MFREIQIFANELKSTGQYIAILLTALFMVTLLPFNMLHHHAEDEHTAAMLHHENHLTHHCELDEQLCQLSPDADCGHTTHVAKQHPKCFACDFSFIKVFEAEEHAIVSVLLSTALIFHQYNATDLHKAFIFVGNKGPPTAV